MDEDQDKDYVTVAKFAEIRAVSPSTVKRRITDKTIKNFKKTDGPFHQEKYMIHISQLSMPQRDLFGPKRPPVSKDFKTIDNDEVQTLLNNKELMTDVRYLRKTIDIASKRLEAL